MLTLIQVWWKAQYGTSSGDHGTLAFFRSRLNRIAVTKDPKKDVNACMDFIYTVVKGHYVACACRVLGISSVDEPPVLPPGIHKETDDHKLAFITRIAKLVVHRCTLVDGTFTNETAPDKDDGVYNYTRVLCHYGSLLLEFVDAWHEGDGERIVRCWKLFLPHFKVAGCTKFALEALKLQFQTSYTLSPNLAHQVTWHRFVNVRGGAGNNIPCDLFNEHMNKLLKYIISNMGSNLTEAALQRAARCVTTLQRVTENFDAQSGVPCRTTAHSTKSDKDDVQKVVRTVLENKLLEELGGRQHKSFKDMKLNPLYKWDVKKTDNWIKAKIKEHQKYNGHFRSVPSENDVECPTPDDV